MSDPKSKSHSLASLANDKTRLFKKYQQQLKINKKLSERLAFLTAIFESSQDSIISKDLKGIITSWNPASEKIYGYSSKEAIGKPITLIFPPEAKEDFPQIMAKLKKGQKVESYDSIRVRKDGRKIHISLSLSPIKDSTGKVIGASCIGRDISEHIEQEKRKDDFISIASHELKTPITTLKGFTQILIASFADLDPKYSHYVLKMDSQIDKLTRLINDLLDVSKIKSKKTQLKKEAFNIDALIQEVAADMQQHTTHHSILVETKVGKEILADKYRISQVLTNLISNAIKYSPRADKIIVRSKPNHQAIQISVQDFGIGIFKKDRQRIFDSFFQTQNKIRESFSGLGLGLFISSEIIKRHQGKIWVDSIKGQGTTFYIQLPYK